MKRRGVIRGRCIENIAAIIDGGHDLWRPGQLEIMFQQERLSFFTCRNARFGESGIAWAASHRPRMRDFDGIDYRAASRFGTESMRPQPIESPPAQRFRECRKACFQKAALEARRHDLDKVDPASTKARMPDGHGM